MKLEPLTLEQCEQVRIWRNEILETLRTPYPLTKEMQEAFYREVVNSRNSPHRYWAIVDSNDLSIFYGMGGITNIQWENSIGEISLIIDPARRNEGYGRQAADLLLDKAFNYLNLQTVCGEVYNCNAKAANFWLAITADYKGKVTVLHNRKYWNGKYYNSQHFSIERDDFNNARLGKKDEK